MQLDIFTNRKMLTLDAKYTNAQLAVFFSKITWKYPTSMVQRTTILQAIELLRNYTPHFCIFWAAYPNKGGIKSSLNAFASCLHENDPIELVAEILLGLHHQFKDRQEAATKGIFYPDWRLASTWLNDSSWHATMRAIKIPQRCEPDEQIMNEVQLWIEHLCEPVVNAA